MNNVTNWTGIINVLGRSTLIELPVASNPVDGFMKWLYFLALVAKYGLYCEIVE